jgi:hypothetical protein
MKATIALGLLALAASGSALADQYVNGYFRSDGTYVAPHYQTAPNDTKLDNYSTKGNVNPYTGQPGYKDPYALPKTYQQPKSYEYKPYEYKPYSPNGK